MKKARIMLALISTLTIAGAVSAFKINKAFSTSTYYVTTVYRSRGTLIIKSAITTIQTVGTYYYYTLIYNGTATIGAWIAVTVSGE